jgi:hypothetical protein
VVDIGFARYLYVPEDGTRFPAHWTVSIERGLRDAGLARGPDEAGVWKPFRPAGALRNYVERLGLVYPTLEIRWYDNPEELVDNYLPPRGPWFRCPTCDKPFPESGMLMAYDRIGLEEPSVDVRCRSCGEDFEASRWNHSDSRVVFSSRLIIALTADGYSSSLPTFREGCPDFVEVVETAVGRPMQEVFVAW